MFSEETHCNSKLNFEAAIDNERQPNFETMGDEVLINQDGMIKEIGLSPIKGCSFLQPRILDQLKAIVSTRPPIENFIETLISRCVAKGLLASPVPRPNHADPAEEIDEILDLVVA